MAAAVASLNALLPDSGVDAFARLAGSVRPGGAARALRLQGRPLPARPRDVALHAPHEDRGGRAFARLLARRAAARVRPRERPLRGGTRHAGRDARDARRLGDDLERQPVVGLLGGDFRAARHRLLVVAGFARAGLPADRRVGRGGERLRGLPPRQRAAPHQAALPEGRDAQPARPRRRRGSRPGHDRLGEHQRPPRSSTSCA